MTTLTEIKEGDIGVAIPFYANMDLTGAALTLKATNLFTAEVVTLGIAGISVDDGMTEVTHLTDGSLSTAEYACELEVVRGGGTKVTFPGDLDGRPRIIVYPKLTPAIDE